MIRACDHLFTGGIVFLIVFTPFAFGAVHPWAYTTMEVVIFALVIIAMVKLVMLNRQRSTVSSPRSSSDTLTPIALPLALFIILCVLQLVPLPPSFLQVISPQTFETYRQILPGWPERVPYAELDTFVATGDRGRGTEANGLQSSVTGQKPETADVRGEALGVRRDAGSEEQSAEPDGASLQSSISGQKAETGDGGPKTGANGLPSASRFFPETWRPISMSATFTKIELLKFAAFAALFLLVWRYPFAEPFEDFPSSDAAFFVLSPEQCFLRTAMFAVLGTGLLVAAVGFIERFTWNGKILWFFVPSDWGEARPNGIPRASGPFVNPDHFANYLSIIFPIALGCALFRTFMVPRSQQYGFQFFCAFTAFLLFTGNLLSLSRGGWISALLGIVILIWLSPWGADGSRHASRLTPHASPHAPHALRLTPRAFARVARLATITAGILLIVSLFLVGSGGREQVDARLKETFVPDLGMSGRMAIWKDSLPMFYDFPVFGVGLGVWSELFTHYQSGPWSQYYYTAAHNDYFELLAETGVVGFGLLAWFFVAGSKRLVHGIENAPSKNLPLLAGILAALGGMALHEWLDYSLQIPANAFLFTVLLAVGLQFAKSKGQRPGSTEQGAERVAPWEVRGGRAEITPQWTEVDDTLSSVTGPRSSVSAHRSSVTGRLSSPRFFSILTPRASRLTPVLVGVAAAFLIVCAVMQDEVGNDVNAQSIAAAKERLRLRPLQASYHLSLMRLAGEQAPLAWQLSEYRAALWIQPTNPHIRDKYAATLIAMGKKDEGLKEISQSVAEAPSLSRHDYLSAQSLPKLSAEERGAVEAGFKQALSREYPEALNNFGEFYAALKRFADQAALYEQAAGKETDIAKKTELLLDAGLAYMKATAEQDADVTGEGLGVRGKATDAKGNEQSAMSKEQGVKTGDGRQTTEFDPQSPVPSPQSTDSGPRSIPNAINATNTNNAINAANAERVWRSAIAINPSDPKAYKLLTTAIYGARKDFAGARQIIALGIKNGAPPLSLYLSLADAARQTGSADETKAALVAARAEVEKSAKNGAGSHATYLQLADGARKVGDREQESAALLKALEFQPRSADTLFRLANLSIAERKFDRAALYLNRVTTINPDSANSYFQLAVAEEGRYRFADAGRAYARALELAPDNANYRDRYEAFKLRVESNRVTGDGGPGLTSRSDGRPVTGGRIVSER